MLCDTLGGYNIPMGGMQERLRVPNRNNIMLNTTGLGRAYFEHSPCVAGPVSV
jgi:hypothetical protein